MEKNLLAVLNRTVNSMGGELSVNEIRKKKEEEVAAIKEKLSQAKSAILTDYRGVNVADMTEFRAQMREAGVEYKVLKNTLSLLAAKELGYDDLEEFLAGPTAFAFSYDDPVSGAKIVKEFSKKNENMKIKVGLVEGKMVSEAEIGYLAELPSREVLLAQLAGTMQAPLAKMARLLQAPIAKFAYAASALRDKQEA